MTSQQVIDFVSTRIAQGVSLSLIAEQMTENCLAHDAMAGIGCDNMTVVVYALLQGKSESDWADSVSKRVEGK